VVRVRDLKRHGDFGLGTFDALDGEMLALDGPFFRLRGSGAVDEAAEDASVPFAAVTSFRPQQRFTIDRVDGIAALLERLDQIRSSDSLFYAVRIDGRFAPVKTRAMCKSGPGRVSGRSGLASSRARASQRQRQPGGVLDARSMRALSTLPAGTSTS
jgi:acetolactate decarboxylase